MPVYQIIIEIKKSVVEFENLLKNCFSAKNALIIFKPLKVSSKLKETLPVLSELDLTVFLKIFQ